MSFVTDVLLSSGQLEKRDYQGEIEELDVKINQAQREVELFLEKHYSEFVPLREKTTYLASVSSKLLTDFSSFKEKVEKELKLQLQFSTREMQTLNQQIQASEAQLEILASVVEMHDILCSLQNVTQTDDLVTLAEKTMKAGRILREAESSLGYRLETWTAIKDKLALHMSYLVQYLNDSWKTAIVWAITEDKSRLTFNCTGKLASLCKAHAEIETLPDHLQSLSTVILDEFLAPLTSPASSLDISVLGGSTHIQVTKSERSVRNATEVFIVLENYKKFFETFVKLFDFKISSGKRMLELVGCFIGTSFVTKFIKNCLKPALPETSAELKSKDYEQLLQLVNQLETDLRSIGFIGDDETSLKNFVDNIETFLINKKCQQTLTKAREIMCQPLHETQVIGELDVNTSSDEQSSRLQDLWETINESNIELKQSPFVFPRCQISQSAKLIASIIESLLEESTSLSSSFTSASRLISTARFVCELYVSVVPEYHRKVIEELPFHAALAHNNCMYLAHYLVTVGCRFADFGAKHCVTFADIVNELRLVGASLFLKHMKIQKDRLVTMIQDGGFSCLAGEPRLPESSEKAINQSLLHLSSLQKVWNSVLPGEVLFKAIGTLINSLLQEILGRVTSLEDIPAEAALQLVSFCQTIVQRLPLLFRTKTEQKDSRELEGQVLRYVANWNKFKELERLLGASLKEIEDRWAAGNGPLAAHFTAQDVKQLVRALFQNTDLRATVLSRIR